MTLTEQIITIAMAVLGVQVLRWIPFLLFPAKRPIPGYVRYLGSVLPAAMFGMLVVYCYKDVSLFNGNHGIPNLVAGLTTLALHLWRKNMFLSITVGTILYMVLVQHPEWFTF